MSSPRQITLLHGKSDCGGAERLAALLRSARLRADAPFIPSMLSAAQAVEWVKRYYAPRVAPGSLLVGLDRGGLVACGVQSALPALRLSVCAVNAPTAEDGLAALPADPRRRVALYSSAYPPIAGRCDWGSLASAFDVRWLADGSKSRPFALAYLIAVCGRGGDVGKAVSMLFPS